MTIRVYAILKEYFDKEFSLAHSAKTVAELRSILIGTNPEAARVLQISRFAVDNEFVDNDYLLKENDQISIMPPSSGG